MKKKVPEKQGISKEKVGYKNPPKKSQWKKGQSGNPKGSSKGKRFLTAALKKKLDEVYPDSKLKTNFGVGDKGTWLDMVIVGLLRGILKGNPGMANIVVERIEGKLTQPISGDEDRPPINITYVPIKKSRSN